MRKTKGSAKYDFNKNNLPALPVIIFQGVVVSLGISIVCVLLFSLFSLLTDNQLVDKYIHYLMVGSMLISIFLGSLFATQKVKAKGLIIGIGVGLIYVLISVGLGMEVTNDQVNFLALVNKMLAGAAVGTLGGLIGVNL